MRRVKTSGGPSLPSQVQTQAFNALVKACIVRYVGFLIFASELDALNRGTEGSQARDYVSSAD